MADPGAVNQEEHGGSEREEEDEGKQRASSSSPRNEHDGKIVTSEQSNENGRDDCSDLTDNIAEEETSKSFPQKLMNILNNEEYSSIISWLPSGNGFVIHKKKTFASEIIPRHFKATQFTSFTRKLNRWGFSRAPRGPDVGAYFHKLFHRDNPELCLQMTSNSGATKAQHTPPPVGPANPAAMMMPGPGMPYFMPNPQMMMNMTPMQQQQAMWQAQYLQQMQQMQMLAFHQQQQAAAAAAAAASASTSQGAAGVPMHTAAGSGLPMQMLPPLGQNPPMIPNYNNMMMMPQQQQPLPQQSPQTPPGDPFPTLSQPQSANETIAIEGTTTAAALEEDEHKEEEPTEDAASEDGGEEVPDFDGADVDFDQAEVV